MRPEKLIPIFKNISSLEGIGPKLEDLFKRIVGEKIVNLLWNLPYNILYRERINNLSTAKIGSLIVIEVTILNHKPSIFKRQPYVVNCLCNNIPLNIVFFYAKHPYIKSVLPENSKRIVSGKIQFFNKSFQITHPEYILKLNDISQLNKTQPIYNLTKGLTQKIYYKTIQKSLNQVPDLNEWIDTNTLKKYKFKSWKESVNKIHNPLSRDDIIKNNIYRKRLAYDELLAQQLSIAIIRKKNIKKKGVKFNAINHNKLFINKLPFVLTKSQKISLDEINKDLISNNQMIRLLQGDVGSGKTIIAISSMFIAFKSGYQSSLMAPTEILANQHYLTIKSFFNLFPIKVIFLSGNDKGKVRIDKIDKIATGDAHIIIGTHALIQDDVKFKKLGLVIIDEQHRFGVHQRLAFTHKGLKPNILVMTATPIPRTLTLAVYGDMDESRIIEKPKGRLPIMTNSVLINKINSVINSLKKKIQNNEKIYWVCPLIEESEDLDLQAATERYKKLKKIFNEKVLLIHGQLNSKEKEDTMNKFKSDSYNILVATTVIEVGIDIPEATTLIIEHSERFGLAQLHQLRGRIGRNSIQSNCILLYSSNIGENAKKRINTMKETTDGFKIAEKDLKLRGPGDLLGKKQSGLPNFKIADLCYDEDILENIRIELDKKINDYFQNDIFKKNDLTTLLYLFECDVAIKTLMSG